MSNKNYPKWGVRVIFIFLVWDFPQWFQSVFSMFTTEPLFPWLQRRGITISPFWTSGALAVVLIFYFAWLDWRRSKKKIDTSLEIEASPTEDRSGPDVHYNCRIRVRNIPTGCRESLDVKLTDWKPIPANPYSTSATESFPMPTNFPILLEAIDDGTQSQSSTVCLQLFNLIRAGSAHTVEIVGKKTKFRYFQPTNTWQTFTIQVQSAHGVLGTQRFKLTFFLDPKGIPAFSVEKDILA
jgi:hypothetical protein